jgi:predicted glycoside hydrolase/deacetylase ChbG (UPF0249 family)
LRGAGHARRIDEDDAITKLIITADDYGYSRRYDAGILAAAGEGLVDAVSAMVGREGLEPGPLLETGVEIGLHLELGPLSGGDRADDADRRRAAGAIDAQVERFAGLFGRPPAYLDGHRHVHAHPGLGVVVADAAARRSLPVRSIDPRHRRLLRCRGVATPDLLIGRLSESEPALPAELAAAGGSGGEGGAGLPAVIEWMVHPGEPDAGAGSSYDAGRAEDLALLRSFRVPAGIRRATHRAALLQVGTAPE